MVNCVGIDVGRDSVKVVGKNLHMCFKARVGEWREMNISSGGKYEVEIDGEKYFIAELADESYFSRSMAVESKIHDETKVLFLSALALSLRDNEKIRVATGMPVSQYNSKERNNLFEFLRGEHNVSIDNRQVDLKVDSLDIIPEGAGVYWDYVLNMEGELHCKTLEKVYRVIDIGSRTVNYCTIVNNKFLDRESGTLHYGTFAYDNALNSDNDDTIKRQFVRKLLGDLSTKWMSLNLAKDRVIVAGGGSVLLCSELKKELPGVVIPELSVYSNAQGFYKKTVAKSLR